MSKYLTTEDGFDLHWQMTNCERFALIGLLKKLQPKLSLEIGTYQGGSLQVLSHFSKRVISVDIDGEVPKKLAGLFDNVDYFSGDSRTLLPQIIATINASENELSFVLIDGDHSAEGVKRDIESVLKVVPRSPLVMIMHDSFNPDCRTGMKLSDWNLCPYVNSVELDFIPGIYHYEAHDTAGTRSMWGGFACAVLTPEKRIGSVIVQESQRYLHEAIVRVSSHASAKQPPTNFWQRLRKRVRGLIR